MVHRGTPWREHASIAWLPFSRAGLGEAPAAIKRLISNDPETLAAFEAAVTEGNGGDRKSEKAKIKSDSVTLDSERENGKANTLRRLAKDKPDLFERVNYLDEELGITTGVTSKESSSSSFTSVLSTALDLHMRIKVAEPSAERVDDDAAPFTMITLPRAGSIPVSPTARARRSLCVGAILEALCRLRNQYRSS